MPLSEIKGLLVDIDGTLLRGDALLPGVGSFFRFLREKELAYLIVSNNTKSPQTYRARFAQKGLDIPASRFFTCVDSTRMYLQQHPGLRRVFVVGKPDLKAAVRAAGAEILEDARGRADAVIVGGDFELDYEKLKNAVLHLQQCQTLIGSNGDMLIPTEEGLVPEAGMTLAALSAATGVQPVVLGKPEPFFFRLVLEKLGLPPAQTAMLGDRLDTDIAGAQACGLGSILVCTGVDGEASIRQKQIHPQYLVQNLNELMARWNTDE